MNRLNRLIVEEVENNLLSWFGNSKVVDDSGNPLKVYHGTDIDFKEFSKDKIGLNHWQSKSDAYGGGFFFTDKKNYASNGSIIKEVYLKIENPLIRSVGDYNYAVSMFDFNSSQFFSDAYFNGNDGIIIKSPKGSLYIVFESSQIKMV